MYELRLFGGASLGGPDGPVSGRAGQRRSLALLALLGVAGERGLSRDKIVAHLWPDTSSQRARHLLSVTLHAIRKALGSEAVLSVADDLRLNPDRVDVDVRAYERALEAGEVERAVELYEGPFLDGFHVRRAPEFERWLDRRQMEYARSYREALEEFAGRAEERGARAEAVSLWKERAAEEPTSSRVAVRLMEALEAAGDRPAALRHARIHARLVQEELGVEPDPEVTRLVERLKSGDTPRPTDGADAASRTGSRSGRTEGADVGALRSPGLAGSRETSPRRSAGRDRTEEGRAPERRGLAGKAALAILALTLTGALIWWGRGPGVEGAEDRPAISERPLRIAVLPFSFEGDPEREYLKHGLPELLARALDGTGWLTTVPPEAVVRSAGGLTARPEEGSAVPAPDDAVDADLHVEGSIVETERELRVAATVRIPWQGATVVERAVADGPAGAPGTAVDRLARGLILKLHDGPSHRLVRSAARATDSLRALKAFIAADRLLRRRGSNAALEPLTEAVAIDSAFALGHYRLAVVASGAWKPELARQSIERALRLEDRLAPEERGLARAFRDHLRGDADAAVQRYRELLDHDVLNLEAWVMLGETLRRYKPYRGRSIHEARNPFRRALSIDPADLRANLGLASLMLAAGRVSAWDSLVRIAYGAERYERWRGYSNSAIYHLGSREELDRRLQRIAGYPSELVDRNAGAFSLWPDLGAARRVARFLTARERSVGWRAAGYVRLAELAFASGRPSEGRALLDSAGVLDPTRALAARATAATLPQATPSEAELEAVRDSLARWRPSDRLPTDPHLPPPLLEGEAGSAIRTYLLGLLDALLGDTEAALRRARALHETEGPPGVASLPRDLALGVRAEVHRRRGEHEAALQALDALDLTVPRHRIHDSPFLVRVRERYLRGVLLYRTGRPREALAWLEGVTAGGMGLLYRGATETLLGEILESTGSVRRARLVYERAESLLARCEPEYRSYLERARAGQARVVRKARGNDGPRGGYGS